MDVILLGHVANKRAKARSAAAAKRAMRERGIPEYAYTIFRDAYSARGVVVYWLEGYNYLDLRAVADRKRAESAPHRCPECGDVWAGAIPDYDGPCERCDGRDDDPKDIEGDYERYCERWIQ